MITKIVKTMEFALQNDQKVAVHCHAGRGRTALLICSYLIYSLKVSVGEAVEMFKLKRPIEFKAGKQIKTLQEWHNFVFSSDRNYFQNKSYR